MTARIITYCLLALSLIACREEVEPQIGAGYIVRNATEEQITIVGDTIPQSTFLIDESTLIEGGALIEGNIAEIIFLPTEDGATPQALQVTADRTYPQALGRWATDKDASLTIDMELLPHGRIAQHAPSDVLRFERWQITGNEQEIMLYGSLSLPPDWAAYNKGKAKDKDLPLPERREQHFSIMARLDKQSDSNTESRIVLIFKANGRESRLYLQP